MTIHYADGQEVRVGDVVETPLDKRAGIVKTLRDGAAFGTGRDDPNWLWHGQCGMLTLLSRATQPERCPTCDAAPCDCGEAVWGTWCTDNGRDVGWLKDAHGYAPVLLTRGEAVFRNGKVLVDRIGSWTYEVRRYTPEGKLPTVAVPPEQASVSVEPRPKPEPNPCVNVTAKYSSVQAGAGGQGGSDSPNGKTFTIDRPISLDKYVDFTGLDVTIPAGPSDPPGLESRLAFALFADRLEPEAARIAEREDRVEATLRVMWERTKVGVRRECEETARRLVKRMAK